MGKCVNPKRASKAKKKPVLLPLIRVGDETFPTVRALRDRLSQVLEAVGPVDDLAARDPGAFAFVWSVLERHPDATTKLDNVARVQLVRVRCGSLTALLHRSDGTVDDVSLRGSCVTGKKSADNDLAAAMRAAVYDQTVAFRESSGSRCSLCSVSGSKTHVDHVFPETFSALCKRFLDGRQGRVPAQFRDTGPPDDGDAVKTTTPYRTGFLEEDADFEADWVAYHRENARLRILCQGCNLSVGCRRRGEGPGDAVTARGPMFSDVGV